LHNEGLQTSFFKKILWGWSEKEKQKITH